MNMICRVCHNMDVEDSFQYIVDYMIENYRSPMQWDGRCRPPEFGIGDKTPYVFRVQGTQD